MGKVLSKLAYGVPRTDDDDDDDDNSDGEQEQDVRAGGGWGCRVTGEIRREHPRRQGKAKGSGDERATLFTGG